MSLSRQTSLFPESEASQYAERTSGSFVGNMDAPVHRWFRYSAGFSGAWAEDLIAREATQRELCVLDPFAGSATTLIAAEQCGVESWGIDAHPFVARVARAKLAYRSSPSALPRRSQDEPWRRPRGSHRSWRATRPSSAGATRTRR